MSAITAIRTQGASNRAARTVPPSQAVRSAVASASSTPNVTPQCDGVSGWSAPSRVSDTTTSAKPAVPPNGVALARMIASNKSP